MVLFPIAFTRNAFPKVYLESRPLSAKLRLINNQTADSKVRVTFFNGATVT